MRLVVDEIKVDEIKQSWESKVNRISNKFLYVGGAPTETHLRLPIFKNFNGCLQNVSNFILKLKVIGLNTLPNQLLGSF